MNIEKGIIITICDTCGDMATERHHKFSQTKRNRSLYGELLDRTENIMHLCYRCHHLLQKQKQ